MQLKEIMTTDEQEAIKDLIAAHLGEQVARLNLSEARAEVGRAARNLTALAWREDGNHNVVGTIPEMFVASFGGDLYLIHFDVDGEHAHKVQLISGILTN